MELSFLSLGILERYWNILNKSNGEIKFMQVSDKLKEDEMIELQKNFYEYFETGYTFKNWT